MHQYDTRLSNDRKQMCSCLDNLSQRNNLSAGCFYQECLTGHTDRLLDARPRLVEETLHKKTKKKHVSGHLSVLQNSAILPQQYRPI